MGDAGDVITDESGGSLDRRMARAKRLLAAEGATGDSAEACAAAAGKVYDKLDAQLSSLLGAAGFEALLVRSAKLMQREFARQGELTVVGGSAQLRAYLRDLDPVTAAHTAEALFGTFFALITTFIGERLATQVLRSAWPTIEHSAPTENEK